MELIGLVNNITVAVTNIVAGRKGFATRGKEQEGRISYETGISQALSAFQKASSQKITVSVDPKVIILAEYTFLSQELEFCDKTDKDSFSSLTKAIQSFDDAFLVLKIVEDKTFYLGAEKSYPHHKKYRVCGFPKDAFHIACIGHETRLQNILRSPGIDTIEKALLKQRFINLSVAQSGYIELQKKALEVK